MTAMKHMPTWEDGEEFWNSLTHAIGAIFSCIGSFFLIQKARRSGDRLQLASYIVFSLSMIELYAASALYHGITDVRYKKPMRFADHCSVFFLIAGTYAPYSLTVLRGHGGIPMLIVVYIIAFTGSFGKLFFFDAIERYTVLIYVAMGWVGLFSIKALTRVLTRRALAWLVAGGVTYTLGTVFFVIDKPYCHVVFHLFILGGTFCHFVSIYFYT